MGRVAFACKKPITGIKEWFGSGLGSDRRGPVASECPEETLESGAETEWGGSYSPAEDKQSVSVTAPEMLQFCC